MSKLSEAELHGILHSGRGRYTQFALEAARDEIATRRAPKETVRDGLPGVGLGSAVNQALTGACQVQPATGCCIEVWQDKYFEGRHRVIEGPVELHTLKSNIDDWNDRISSLRVGPTAFVLAFRGRDFQGRMVTFGPNEEVPDLEQYKFDDKIDSVLLVDSLKVFDHQHFEDEVKPSLPPLLDFGCFGDEETAEPAARPEPAQPIELAKLAEPGEPPVPTESSEPVDSLHNGRKKKHRKRTG